MYIKMHGLLRGLLYAQMATEKVMDSNIFHIPNEFFQNFFY